MKKDRNAIRDFVIDSMANGDESVETIMGDVSKWAKEACLSFSREMLIDILRDLMSQDYVKAYRPLGGSGQYEDCEIRDDLIDEMWFYLTPQGRTLLDKLPPLPSDR